MEQAGEIMTTAEAAAFLRKPPETLRYWRYLGVGPRYSRLGRSVVYVKSDLRSFVDANAVDPQGGSL